MVRPTIQRFGALAFTLIAMSSLASGASVDRFDPTVDATGSIQATRATTTPENMREGALHSRPKGWREMCELTPEHCAPPSLRRPKAITKLDPEGHAQLARFNAQINAAFRPAMDPDAYGVADLWRVPTPGDAADCEDYALAKRTRLITAGWPPESVLLAVVRGDISPYHAVLVVRTDRGELVLDNLTDDIRDWRSSGYSWVVRQSSAAPERWVRVIAEPHN